MKKKASKKAKKSSYIKVRDLKPDKNPKGGLKTDGIHIKY